MSVSKRFLNWAPVTFTPTNTAIPATVFTAVMSVMTDRNANLLKGAGDNDPGPTEILCDHQEPTCGLKLEAVAEALAIAPGTSGTFTAQLLNAQGGGGTGSGALLVTLSPCVALPKSVNGAYRKFAESDIEFHGVFTYAQDGTVLNPLSVVRQ